MNLVSRHPSHVPWPMGVTRFESHVIIFCHSNGSSPHIMAASRYPVGVVICGFLTGASGILNATILIYGMWKPPYLQCLPYTAPGFELASASVNELYSDNLNINLQFISSKSVAYCPDISANYEQVAQRYYDFVDKDMRPHAVFYPGCDASTTLADFGREWNVLVINTGTTFSNLRNRTTYPTTLALGPYQYQIYGVMIAQLTASYNWTSVAIVHDVSSTSLVHLLVAQEIRRYMRRFYEHVDAHAFPVDTKQNINFQPIITEISILSRVIVIAMPVDDVQRFLVAFVKSGESREAYVLICVDYTGSTGSALSQLQTYAFNNTDVIKTLWPSVLVISICYKHDDVEIPKLKRAMRERAGNVYNSTPKGEPSEFVVTAYTSLLLYAKVLNKTLQTGRDSYDGALLARSMLNRTFAFPVVGSLYIDKHGERQNTICLYNFQPALRRFEKVRYFDSATQMLYNVPNVSINWASPENLPPLNEPQCGFRKDKCSRISTPTLAAVVSGTALVALIVCCIVPVVLRMQKQTDNSWWIVDLRYLNLTVESGSSEISGRRPQHSFKSNVLINAPMNYRGIPVWAKVVQVTRQTVPLQSPLGTIGVTPGFSALMSEVRLLTFRCPNINSVIGIGLGSVRVTYLTALCQRGNLGTLIDEISLDWGLKCSLIADLLEGVSAIHRTPIRRHGHLRPSKCLIDGRFVLKINEVGLYDTLNVLQVRLINRKNFEAIRETLHDAWVAPELQADLLKSATFATIALHAQPSADVYAVGGLVHCILQNRKPEKDEKLVQFAESGKYEIPLSAVPVLATVLYECRNTHPADRPSMSHVKMEIDRVIESPGRLLEGLIRRLADYAVQLENAVTHRTQILKQEMEKCDLLLGEMLPRYVLVQLRIGHLVQPQIFHSVTILMTYVAGFDEFVLKCQSTPLEIVTFLNTMFTLFDRIFVKHDCYKVETVTDSCLVVSGLPVENGEHAHVMARLSLEIRKDFGREFAADGLHIKAGLHSGSCAAGVVGTARPRYCVFGDSVNITSRLAYSSQQGKIHISNTIQTKLSVDSGYKIHPRGRTYLKGVESITTFWLEG